MTREVRIGRYRRAPDCVVLPGNDGSSARGKPPVRIFLGTEDGQWRAERIFVYSVEQVRDPGRTYEVHLMKNLDGFDRRGWRTGFTNYRYAVPELAGFEGRTIYNDVDQIYFADPAELFDTDLGRHGYLSVSAADTSVMLLDCARLRSWWNREKASVGSKQELLSGPAAEPGLWGELDAGWNARDMEFVRAESKLLHFTALHLQPWQPFPDQYSYHAHPLGDLWLDMERRADAEGFQVYGPGRPSPHFAGAIINPTEEPPDPAVADSAGRFIEAKQPRSVLAATTGASSWKDALPDLGGTPVTDCPVGCLVGDTGSYDLVAAPDLLHACPAEDVPWIIEALFARAARAVWLSVRCCRHAYRERDVDVRRAIRPIRWWHQQVAAIARRYPHTAWQLDARGDQGIDTIRAPGQPEQPPAAWVLEGARTGDNAQLYHLAGSLGWPVKSKPLHYNKLHMLPNALLGASLAHLRPASRARLTPPWPDLVVASGKRNSGVARWIKRQSGGGTKLVHLGRPWARLDAFDLIVTTPQYRLPVRDNVHRNVLPITPVDTRALAERRRRILDDFAELPRPRIALLVGGGQLVIHLRTCHRAPDRRPGIPPGRRKRRIPAGRDQPTDSKAPGPGVVRRARRALPHLRFQLRGDRQPVSRFPGGGRQDPRDGRQRVDDRRRHGHGTGSRCPAPAPPYSGPLVSRCPQYRRPLPWIDVPGYTQAARTHEPALRRDGCARHHYTTAGPRASSRITFRVWIDLETGHRGGR